MLLTQNQEISSQASPYGIHGSGDKPFETKKKEDWDTELSESPPSLLERVPTCDEPNENNKRPSRQDVACRRNYCSLCAAVSIIALVGFVVYGMLNCKGWMPHSSQNEDFQGAVTTEELKAHDNPDDCWIAYHGHVYDQTEYLGEHPGGAEIMVGLCGCDGTSQYDVYHTKALLRSIQSELIGDMVQYNDGTPDSHSDNPQGCNCLNCDGNCQCCNANISASEGEGKEDDDRGSSEQTNIPSKEDATDVIIDDETNSHTDIQVIEEIDEPTSIPIVEDPSKNDIENEMDDSVSTPPTQEDESPHPALTMTEVALHSTSDDCYVVYYDQVYFMSTYAPEHPFGASWILNLCGKDGTSRYSRFHQRELLLTVQDMIVGGLIL